MAGPRLMNRPDGTQMPRAQRQGRGIQSAKAWCFRHANWLCGLALCGLIAVAFCAGRSNGQSQPSYSLPAIDLPKTTTNSGQPKTPANPPEKQEITKESDDLLKMAMDLKSEVDKTTKDTLSLSVVRKASEIEQMAHKVRTGTAKEVGQR